MSYIMLAVSDQTRDVITDAGVLAGIGGGLLIAILLVLTVLLPVFVACILYQLCQANNKLRHMIRLLEAQQDI